MAFNLITGNSELADICNFYKNCNQLALDTEFKRETSYYPIPCLVQIEGGNQISLIDPLHITDFSPLTTLLADTHIVKILHASRQDLEVFQVLLNSTPTSIFDTQIAAALLGDPNQIGYSTLVQQFFDIELDKTLTRTDWEKRPLSDKELVYAANDVKYLNHIFQIQSEKLDKLNRLSWLEEEVNNMIVDSNGDDALDKVWKKISRSARLNAQQRNVAFALNQWRENQAIKRNRARQFIISNEVLMGIAFHQPNNISELNQISKIPKPFIKRYSEEILELIHAEDTRNLNIPDSTQQKLTPEENELLKILKSTVQQVAAELKIDESFVCNRKSLETLARGNIDNKVMQGWRKNNIGDQLLNIVQNG